MTVQRSCPTPEQLKSSDITKLWREPSTVSYAQSTHLLPRSNIGSTRLIGLCEGGRSRPAAALAN